MMYIVRFVRRDDKPDEVFHYQSIVDAKYHLSLFDDDDSDLYKKLSIESYDDDLIEQIDAICF